MNTSPISGWDRLRHGGLLLDAPRLQTVARFIPPPLDHYSVQELRRQSTALLAGGGDTSTFVSFVLERICGFIPGTGTWLRGSAIGTEWNRRTPTGDSIKPRQLWRGPHGAILPVFIDSEKNIGIGRGRRTASQVIQWLRAGSERLALLTNGRQWRLVFAGIDFDAWCEWDVDLWFEEGELSSLVLALRTLISPQTLTPTATDGPAPLLTAILDSRKGQAELSAALGERVREAVELLVRAHGDVLLEHCADVEPAEIYRAAVRIVMRMVVVLFAESRDLMPRGNALYHGTYSIGGLLEELEKAAARGGGLLSRSHSAWPRILALFQLVHQGSHHPALPVPAYGGDFFAPALINKPSHGETTQDGLSRALNVFENAAFDTGRAVFPDRDVLLLLEKISRTRVRLRQGRQNTWVTMPVDFSDLSSEYIGILYEGLLDFELKTAPDGDPIIFLAIGKQPALPLSRLESMDDRALATLLEKMKDTASQNDDETGESDDSLPSEDATTGSDDNADADDDDGEEDDALEAVQTEALDQRHVTRTRAEQWARRAVTAGGLVPRLRGTITPEKRRAHDEVVSRKARQLVVRVVLPGEWYLVRWGGTRKGSGTFYTRPGLAVPTVQRTLRPLAYQAPTKPDGTPDTDAPARAWQPRLPEEILNLKVCDPACGSGTFPVASLRYLTDALYASVHHHGRVTDLGDRSVVSLLGPRTNETSDVAPLGQELVPCRHDDSSFEPRLKGLLKRHVVERCIYGVDLDPLAVELCRLSLWIETMDRSLPFSFIDHKVKCGNGLIGAWFDQFQHYPVMAWKNREGGDKNHSNGVHFAKEARGKAIRKFTTGRLKTDLAAYLSDRSILDPSETAQEQKGIHDEALEVLSRLHNLPVQDAAERSRIYREELLNAPAWAQLKAAMDLWCACWFWPAEALEHAPLPSTLARPSKETLAESSRITARLRFFHWELEFPDVFCATGSGFDAMLGNPPWETLQPSSKEFFSNIDPLYRTYGKQEALRTQTEYFAKYDVERQWLDYNASFAGYSNWMKYAARPYGDPATSTETNDRYNIARGDQNDTLHERWRKLRLRAVGYADSAHPFLHRGEGKAYTYKLFLETGHALLRIGGRLGFIVPSGLYSDHGTGALRRLFLDRCRWEWLFGFENREGVFDIDGRFKFNPIIVEKGGTTSAIRTAFMRRKLEDWERAEQLATPYTRAQVDQFSPHSKAILEIQSQRDLEILEKIYANSVLLGDDGPDGWGIKYAQGDFNMTSDSKLFPPRSKWEEQGYRPDEYSRWLKGDWRPIEELWAELGIDPRRVKPMEINLEDWLFDTSAGPDRRTAEARLAHGHLLKPGDVARTPWRLRCTQPPYDGLPIPRADIPPGIVLSRDADAWIRENRVQDVALPLYEGKAIWLHDWAYQEGSIVTGGVRQLTSQYLIGETNWSDANNHGARVVFRDISNATNARTFIAALIPARPCGNPVPLLNLPSHLHKQKPLLVACLASLVFDWTVRQRMSGTHLNWHIAESLGLPRPRIGNALLPLARSVDFAGVPFSVEWLRSESNHRITSGISESERLRASINLDVGVGGVFNLTQSDYNYILTGSDVPRPSTGGTSKGFWRVDKDKDPELRHTVLTLIAFHDLETKIRENAGDRDAGIAAFIAQNHGEGWLLPETLRLADYGLGHDERAQHHQPVASRLGPRFYDWQLTQSAEESWRECHLHARNLLGEAGYRELLANIEAERSGKTVELSETAAKAAPSKFQQGTLFK